MMVCYDSWTDRLSMCLGHKISRVAVPWWFNLQLVKLAIGTLNDTSLLGKETELVREVRYSWPNFKTQFGFWDKSY